MGLTEEFLRERKDSNHVVDGLILSATMVIFQTETIILPIVVPQISNSELDFQQQIISNYIPAQDVPPLM